MWWLQVVPHPWLESPVVWTAASSSRDDDLFSDEDVMSYTYWDDNQLWTLALAHAAWSMSSRCAGKWERNAWRTRNGGASVDCAGTCCTLLGILVFFLMWCWHIHLHLLQRKSLCDGVLPVNLAIKALFLDDIMCLSFCLTLLGQLKQP